MDEKQVLKFEFTVEEINTVLGALGTQSYQQVAGLIDNIRQQAAPQLQPAAPVEAPAE